MIHRVLALLSLAGLVTACPSPQPPPEATPGPDDGDGLVDGATPAGPVEVGDWTAYAEPEAEEWPTEALDTARWTVVTAELACASRANHGDPDEQRQASRRILAHYRTTGVAVMEHGIEVNAEPERAQRLGEAVATATERCR